MRMTKGADNTPSPKGRWVRERTYLQQQPRKERIFARGGGGSRDRSDSQKEEAPGSSATQQRKQAMASIALQFLLI